VASENAHQRGSQQPESASENTSTAPRARRGRAPAQLPEPAADVLESYVSALAAAPLAEQTRRTYASKVRQYLAWLAGAELDSDPLDSAGGRDWAVRDYRAHLQAVLKRKPATVNSAFAALDDFYIRRGLGAASAKRARSRMRRPARSTTRPKSATSGPCRGAGRRGTRRSR
jgi:hypothetical protein